MPAASEILWDLDFQIEAGSDKFWKEIVINSFEKKGSNLLERTLVVGWCQLVFDNFVGKCAFECAEVCPRGTS